MFACSPYSRNFLCCVIQIARLQYTCFGAGLLALDTNALHKLWKWNREDRNLSEQATTNYSPELWRPNGEIDMKNDTSARGPGEVNPCMALTNNDSYLMSCSGGKMALFNLQTFQVRHSLLIQNFILIYFLLSIVITPFYISAFACLPNIIFLVLLSKHAIPLNSRISIELCKNMYNMDQNCPHFNI